MIADYRTSIRKILENNMVGSIKDLEEPIAQLESKIMKLANLHLYELRKVNTNEKTSLHLGTINSFPELNSLITSIFLEKFNFQLEFRQAGNGANCQNSLTPHLFPQNQNPFDMTAKWKPGKDFIVQETKTVAEETKTVSNAATQSKSDEILEHHLKFYQASKGGIGTDASFLIGGPGGTLFRIHKALFQIHTSAFYSLLDTCNNENIILRDISAHTFDNIVYYIYTGETSKFLDPEGAMFLFFAAERFLLPKLQEKAKRKAELIISEKSFEEIKIFFDVYLNIGLKLNSQLILEKLCLSAKAFPPIMNLLVSNLDKKNYKILYTTAKALECTQICEALHNKMLELIEN